MKNPLGSFLSSDKFKEMFSEKNVKAIISDIQEEFQEIADKLNSEISDITENEKVRVMKEKIKQKTGMNSLTVKIAVSSINMFINDRKKKYGSKINVSRDEFINFITKNLNVAKETAEQLYEIVKSVYFPDENQDNTSSESKDETNEDGDVPINNSTGTDNGNLKEDTHTSNGEEVVENDADLCFTYSYSLSVLFADTCKTASYSMVKDIIKEQNINPAILDNLALKNAIENDNLEVAEVLFMDYRVISTLSEEEFNKYNPHKK